MFTLHCVCVHCFCPVRQLITEHTLSKATTSITVTHRKLLLIKEKMDIMNKADTTVNVLCKKNR